MGCSKSNSQRKVYGNTILPQETRKTSNRQSNFTPKTTDKRRTKTPKISRRKEVIKSQAEINEKEMKETIVKINKTKSWFFEKIKLTNLWPDSPRKKREKNQINKIRSKKERLQQTMKMFLQEELQTGSNSPSHRCSPLYSSNPGFEECRVSDTTL